MTTIEERKKRLEMVREEDFIIPKYESNCEMCIHYLGDKKCIAWGNYEIPEEIWKGNHDKVLDGQSFPRIYTAKGDIL